MVSDVIVGELGEKTECYVVAYLSKEECERLCKELPSGSYFKQQFEADLQEMEKLRIAQEVINS